MSIRLKKAFGSVGKKTWGGIAYFFLSLSITVINMTREEQSIEAASEYVERNKETIKNLLPIWVASTAFISGAHWADEHYKNLWHDAQDDLPDIDREVIVLCEDGKVCFGHRPNPNGYDWKSLSTGKVQHYTPQTYGKSGWNIPDVKLWLDIDVPDVTDVTNE